MNKDDQAPDLQPWIEPDLEARIVAAVLGEVAPFEAAELERLANDKPEIAIFRRRIEAVHGLVGVATKPDREPMRLSAERRAKVLAAFGESGSSASAEVDAKVAVFEELAEKKRRRRARQFRLLAIAASLMFVATAIVTVNVRRETRFAALAERANISKAREMAPVSLLTEPEEMDEDAPRANFAATFAVPMGRPAGFAAAGSKHGDVAPMTKIEIPSLGDLNFKKQIADASGSAKTDAGQTWGGVYHYSPPAPAARINGYGGLAAAATSAPSAVVFGSTKSNLADVGSSLSVVTNQFLADTGGKSQEKTLAFSAPAKDAAAERTETDEELVTLSPFSVESSPDQTGYTANSTLAGSRIRSGLGVYSRDVNRIAVKQRAKHAAIGAAAGPSFSPNDGFLSGATTAKAKPAAVAPTSDSAAAAEDRKLSEAVAPAEPTPPREAIDALRAETKASDQPFSTFSLHVSDVSYRLAQAALARGETVDPERIRPEEFYNAFDYGDPAPALNEKIGCRIEQSAHPFLQQRNLVRIAMRVPSAGREANQPLRLTVLLDTSGSMERADRVATVQAALRSLTSLLGANDHVTLIGFSRQPRLITEDLAGNDAGKLVDLAAKTPFTGGTNLEQALQLASEMAIRHRLDSAQNRIVLLTDGAANLGNADPAQLATRVETLRQKGIAFDACGVGTDGLDDAILEALTRKGDGRYYLLDQPEDADSGFAHRLAGAFHPAAENVKLQVRFNPARVGQYRLIGFEQHRLRTEDFRNDKIDAAELAAGEDAVALYQVEVLPNGDGELGDVFVRFRDAASGQMVERSWPMLYDPHTPAFDRATPSIQLAGTAALLAEKLRGGELGASIDLNRLTPIVNALREHYAPDKRVQELATMFEQLRRLQR